MYLALLIHNIIFVSLNGTLDYMDIEISYAAPNWLRKLARIVVVFCFIVFALTMLSLIVFAISSLF